MWTRQGWNRSWTNQEVNRKQNKERQEVKNILNRKRFMTFRLMHVYNYCRQPCKTIEQKHTCYSRWTYCYYFSCLQSIWSSAWQIQFIFILIYFIDHNVGRCHWSFLQAFKYTTFGTSCHTSWKDLRGKTEELNTNAAYSGFTLVACKWLRHVRGRLWHDENVAVAQTKSIIRAVVIRVKH